MTTIIEDTKLDFNDVLLMPKRSTLDSRSNVNVMRILKFKYSPVEYTGVPIIAANMDTTGTIEMAKAFQPYYMAVALHKFYTVETLFNYFTSADRNYHTFYTMGITEDDYLKFRVVQGQLYGYSPQAVVRYLCIDVANGYSRKFVNFVEKVREEYPELVIMAGNVVTGDMVYDLLERGADIVKVGIGPGSVCTTRRITGVGYPQLSAILECQDAAHGAGGLICGDGGITVPGDLSKAFAAGSDFVMCGGIFAGHKECAGEISALYKYKEMEVEPNLSNSMTTCVIDGRSYVIDVMDYVKFKRNYDLKSAPPKEWEWLVESIIDPNAKMRFYGMSSHEAMDKHYGGKADYKASEGKIVEVPYKGPVSNTIEEMLGGLRSACTYIGARRLKDMPKCATFVKVNRQLNNSLSEYNV